MYDVYVLKILVYKRSFHKIFINKELKKKTNIMFHLSNPISCFEHSKTPSFSVGNTLTLHGKEKVLTLVISVRKL